MKKLGICIFLVLLSMSVLFAGNKQAIYTTRDDVYKRVDALCRRAGVIGPSSFSPMSAQVLIIALDRIDVDSLSFSDLEEYSNLYGILTEPDSLFSSGLFSVDLDLAANLSGNIADYSEFDFSNSRKGMYWDRREDTLLPYRYTLPALRIGGEFNFGDNVTFDVDFDFGNDSQRLYETSLGWIYTTVGNSTGFHASFPPEMPYRAGGSFGNDFISFIIGRFPHSIGSGITGNLTVGDNFIYQEIANLSFISNYFSYNISMTRFDRQVGIVDKTDGADEPSVKNDNLTTFSRNEFSGMQQFRVIHRFDINILNKARFAINLATIYNSTNGVDFRFFAPFIIAHNYYNYNNEVEMTYFDEANNLMGFDFELNIIKGLSFSAQVVIDQFQMFFEEDDFPNAYGFLGNLKYSAKLGEGNFDAWFEAVYTNPYLYLNEKRNSEKEIDYNLDYIVGYHIRNLSDYGYSGYIYGPDSIVFSLGGKYTAASNRWEVGGNVLYRIKGEKALKHTSNTIDMSNSHLLDDNDIESPFSNELTPSGGWENAEQLLKLACFGIYRLPDYSWGQISFYTAVGFNNYFNYERVAGAVKFLPQMMIGVTWLY